MYEIPDKWFDQLPLTIRELIHALYNGLEFDFDTAALALFEWQRKSNPVFKSFLNNLGSVHSPTSVAEIPCLPIQFFKHYDIKSGQFDAQSIFRSSGTTMSQRSKHHLLSGAWYNKISEKIFTNQFGPLEGSVVLGLLPHYQALGDSSLIYMVSHFIEISNEANSGFYPDQFDDLKSVILESLSNGKNVFLFGIPYALLDFMDHTGNVHWPGLTIIETGGMKGKRAEISKTVFHDLLKDQLGTIQVFSEYGMTELLSQFYTKSDQTFADSMTARVIIKEVNDPFTKAGIHQTGRVNIIDLANLFSCAFIETDDLGKNIGDHTFELAGRIDYSDIRGCNLLIGNEIQ
jgi:hypothetical protein